MMHYIIKLLVSAALIVAVSEVSKRSSFLGGLLASLALVSLLSMPWLYRETGSAVRRPEARKENNPAWGDRLIFEIASKESRQA